MERAMVSAIIRKVPPRRNEQTDRSLCRTPGIIILQACGAMILINPIGPQTATIPPTASAVMEMKTILVTFTFTPLECAILSPARN